MVCIRLCVLWVEFFLPYHFCYINWQWKKTTYSYMDVWCSIVLNSEFQPRATRKKAVTFSFCLHMHREEERHTQCVNDFWNIAFKSFKVVDTQNMFVQQIKLLKNCEHNTWFHWICTESVQQTTMYSRSVYEKNKKFSFSETTTNETTWKLNIERRKIKLLEIVVRKSNALVELD